MADLAADAEDIKSRLANVPVYTVANKKNEFVLVSGEVCSSALTLQITASSCGHSYRGRTSSRADNKAACQGESDTKQLGLFFFSEPDARALVEKVRRAAPFVGQRLVRPELLTLRDAPQIREQNPKLAKQTQVLKVTVDKASAGFYPPPLCAMLLSVHLGLTQGVPLLQVYDFAITPNGAGVPLQGANGASVVFRFMPDAREVQSALEVRTRPASPTAASPTAVGCRGAAAPASLEPNALFESGCPLSRGLKASTNATCLYRVAAANVAPQVGMAMYLERCLCSPERVSMCMCSARKVWHFAPTTGAALGAQLYQDAGIVADEFVGVPVFQAEGLTVKTERARYTPLFLARADLDAAVGNAYSRRGGEREASASAEVAAASEADQKAQAAVRCSRQLLVSQPEKGSRGKRIC